MSMGRKQMLSWWVKFHRRARGGPAKKDAVALIVTGMEKGGLEQVILDLYHGYKKRGIRAYIVCQNRRIEAVKDLVDAPEDLFVFDSDLPTLIHFLWRRDVRALHYHYNTFGMKELRFLGFRIIYTMHNTYTWMSDEEIRRYAEILTNADTVVPVSASVRDYFLRRTQNRSLHLQVINNGIDFSDFEKEGVSLPYSREDLGIGHEDVTVGFVGSFYHAKSQIGMLGVAERLIRDYPQLKFVFLGNNGDENYHRRFMEEYQSCEARDHIVFAPPISHEQMGCFYRQIVDIFVLPTLHEGNPLVALEAMYCGRPMVLTPIGIADELSEKAACLVCDAAYPELERVTDDEIKNHLSLQKHPANEASIAGCIAEIADHLPEYQAKADGCRSNVEEYSIDRMVDAYVKLLH